jgi:hypothetical protein
MAPLTDAYTWQGRRVLGRDGEKIGAIKEIYEDDRTGKPGWALVTSGLCCTGSHFVPLAGLEPAGEHVRVRVSKEQVKDAPSIAGDGQLSEQGERRLFEHYGVPYTEEGSVTAEGAPRGETDTGSVGHDTSGPNPMTR